MFSKYVPSDGFVSQARHMLSQLTASMQDVLRGGFGCSDLSHSDCSMMNQTPVPSQSRNVFHPKALPFAFVVRTPGSSLWRRTCLA